MADFSTVCYTPQFQNTPREPKQILCSFSQLDFLASAQTNDLVPVRALPMPVESNPALFIIRASPGFTPPPRSHAISVIYWRLKWFSAQFNVTFVARFGEFWALRCLCPLSLGTAWSQEGIVIPKLQKLAQCYPLVQVLPETSLKHLNHCFVKDQKEIQCNLLGVCTLSSPVSPSSAGGFPEAAQPLS